MKRPSLMDPSFKYVKSAETDLKKTFIRILREMKLAESAKQKEHTVLPMRAKKGKS